MCISIDPNVDVTTIVTISGFVMAILLFVIKQESEEYDRIVKKQEQELEEYDRSYINIYPIFIKFVLILYIISFEITTFSIIVSIFGNDKMAVYLLAVVIVLIILFFPITAFQGLLGNCLQKRKIDRINKGFQPNINDDVGDDGDDPDWPKNTP